MEKTPWEEDYELLEMVGTGGSGVVYRARDRKSGGIVALKLMDIGASGGPELWEGVDRSLYHPALPAIHRVICQSEPQPRIALVMEYVEGISMDKLLEEKGAQPQDKVLDWGIQLCHVLMYLHGFRPPIIYRDVKPANIMLQPNGRLKLIDLGAMRLYGKAKRRDTRSLGTMGYAAPEQYGRRRQTDARTDVYCLGVTLYHMLTGHDPSEPPYEICRIRKWNRKLDRRLERIVLRCTRRNPAFRYRDCGELLRDLEKCKDSIRIP